MVIRTDYGATHMGMHIGISYRPATFDWMETPGQRIRRIRKALGLNQTDLAAAVGVDQSTISDIERGGGFSAELLIKIADALGCTAGILMRGHDAAMWPFKRVPIERFLALNTEDRSYVEGKLDQALDNVSTTPTAEDLAIVAAARVAHTKKPAKRRVA